MSTYRLTTTTWLAREVERVKGVLLVHMHKEREYTAEELITMLRDYGLDYTNPEWVEIGKQLLAEGIIEAV